ncbi:hypothetical protein HU200_003971 [Digitaria exilis]|uniref:AAA+ ATPase domain-containing protein n=1 Tax=Digitaria exilis TaxID=1010633 RepID=A0A835KSQ0_9POAL|nr:hypothetical protein HU200_003971 [Digitaria exilis]
MPHPSATMLLRSPSSLRSLIRLLRPPTPPLRRPLSPRLPGHALCARPRFLSSSSSPAPGSLTDSLSASAALPSHSTPDAPADSDSWSVFDPVAGRIFVQGSPPHSSSTTAAAAAEEEEEEEKEDDDDEEEDGEDGEVAGEQPPVKKPATARGAKAQTSWSSVVAARKPAGKGVKEKFTYVCSNCKEAEGQWWGTCPTAARWGPWTSSLILVGGDPGVGKSSLMLQLASNILEGFKVEESSPVVYVSGEESIEQIGNRADRMSIASSKLYLYSGTDIELPDNKVKECTSALLRFAKLTNIPVFLIGHVTKSGDIAGPRLLEHIVDVVLYMEGERCSSHRLLRSVKNRFGSTDELGVFEMAEFGLQAVLNPSQMFLTEHDSDSEIMAGLAVAVILDGSRTFALEVQVLMKQAGLKLQDSGIFLNVVSGIELTETAGDLAIAASICSSFLEFPIPNDVAFIGEIGLGGELRTVPRMDKRVMAIAKLGYKKCVVPKTSEKLLKPLNLDIEIVACSNLKQFINAIFRPQD